MAAGGGIPNLVSWAHCYGQMPVVGPKALPMSFSWASQGSFNIDLTVEVAMKVMENIQGLWFDNTGNTNAVTIAFQGFVGYSIKIPASQGFIMPIFVPAQTVQAIISSTVAASQATSLIFLNVPVPVGRWA